MRPLPGPFVFGRNLERTHLLTHLLVFFTCGDKEASKKVSRTAIVWRCRLSVGENSSGRIKGRNPWNLSDGSLVGHHTLFNPGGRGKFAATIHTPRF
jgi:hypothetical protein